VVVAASVSVRVGADDGGGEWISMRGGGGERVGADDDGGEWIGMSGGGGERVGACGCR
jgi:hypothetical protein